MPNARQTTCAAIFLLIAMMQPVTAQERQWSLDASGEDAFMVFGVPETDDVGLSFWCKIGSGFASMFYPVHWTKLRDNSNVKVRAEVGSVRLNLTGKASSGVEGASSSLEVQLKLSSSLFNAIKNNDRVVLRVKGHKATYPLLGADVDGFLRLCRQN